jgi:ribosomal protein S18 acetylase RimI-like enzyme
MKSILSRLQDALIESTSSSRATTETGEFIVLLTPDDPLIWLNYAVPIAEATDQGVDEMCDIFRAANRVPRLEFFVDLWPNTITVLESNGFVCEKRMPIMVLRREDWGELSHDHDVRGVDVTTYHDLNRVMGQAFGMEAPGADENLANPEDDPPFQRVAAGITLASVALVEGKVVGGGFGVGTPEIREIAGIATLSDYRKRGIASAVIAHLLDQFFQSGGEIAWLTPGDDSAQSVYANLGFKTIAEQVVYELPNLSEAT